MCVCAGKMRRVSRGLSGLRADFVSARDGATCNISTLWTLFSWEVKSVCASCAAFKSADSHEAEARGRPQGILCEPPALIRRQLLKNGGRGWTGKVKSGDGAEERKHFRTETD